MGFCINRPLKVTLLAALLTSVAPMAVLANPVDGVVAAGSASMASVGSTLTVTQSTDKAVIDWRGFDIGASETTNFVQPTSHSLTVNRVGSGGASQIYGNLTANGNIVIINPNGVVFGAGSHVDVNGLIATSANASNADLMAGNLKFDQAGNPNATIENRGFISAKDEGLVGLVAPNVLNSGIISAKLGRIHLASGDTATVDLYGDGLIEVKASDALANQLVENTGILSAQGGTIAMTAAAGRETVDSLVHVSGLLDARSIGSKNGHIYIYAEGSTAVAGNVAANKGQKTGTSTVIVENAILNASGRNPGEHGGSITITGDNVALLAGTILDASGYEGLSNTTANGKLSDIRIGAAGGDIQIGGDYLGGGITPTAMNLYVDPSVLVLNDALESGDAGRTIFWSDGTTQFYGNVYARALGGQPVDPVTWNATQAALVPGRRRDEGMGGFVETSGHGHLDAGGYVDLTAASGNRGTYFLDPTDITIYGNVDPTFVSTDGTLNLASSLKLWLDASDTANVSLTYNSLGTTATGTSGTNTITVSANTGLVVGARIRLGGAGSVTAASTVGSDTYTISAIAGTTITLSSNLTASYAASGVYQGYVSQISDKSGVGNNATQATAASMPLWISNGQNGLGTTSFDRVNDVLTVLDAPTLDNTSGLTVFAVNKPTVLDGNPNAIFSKRVASGNNDAYGVFYYTGNFPNVDVDTSNNRFSTPTAATVSVINQFTLWYDGTQAAAARVKIYQNDALVMTATETSASIPNYASDFTVGYLGGNSSSYFGGTIPEIALYNTALSTNARSLVDQYQSAKWGFALTPPGSGATEAAQATASVQKGDAVDGYSVFTTRYLERLSQSANISLQASNNINLDLKGDTLNFTTAGRSLALTAGNQITTASTGTVTTNNGAISLTATNGIAINNNLTLNSGGGAIGINSPTAIATGATLTLNDGGSNNTISSIISGVGALTKAGTGTLTLSGANTYTGATTVSAGTLQAGIATNAFGNNSAVTLSTGSTLDLAGFNETIGSLAGTGGTVTDSNATAASLTTGGNNSSTSYAGIIQNGSGTVSLTKAGTGTLTLTGANTYTGTTTVNAGTLQIGNGGTTGALGSGAVTDNAALIFNRSDAITVANAISGTGSLTQAGAGTTTLSGASSYTGTTTINGGVLSTSSLAANGSNSNIGAGTAVAINGGTLRYTGGANATFNRNFTIGASGGTIDVASLTGGVTYLFFNGTLTGAGNLNIIDSAGVAGNSVGYGQQLLITSNNAATYSGNVTIGNGSALSGWLQLRNGGQVGSGTITINSGGALTTDVANSTVANALILNGGALGVQSNATTYSGNISLTADSLLCVPTGSAATATLSGIISGSYGLTKQDSNTVILSGANTYTGATNVNAGILTLNGSWNVGVGTATTSVASGATLSGTGVITAATLSDSGAGTVNLTGNNLITTLATTGTIGDFRFNNAQSLTAGAITATGKTVNLSASAAGNTITTTGAIAVGTAGNITLTADDLILGGNLSGTGILTLQPTTLARTVDINNGAPTGSDFNLSNTEIGYFTHGWSEIDLGNVGATTHSINIGSSGATTFQDNVVFRTPSGSYFNNTITMQNGSSFLTTGNIDLSSSASINTTNASVTIGGQFYGYGGTINTAGGAVNIGSLATWNSGVGATVNSSGGTININGNSGEYGPTPSGVRAFTLNAGAGAINFNGTVNANYSITATGGAINLNGYAWGGTTQLGNVTLTSTNSISLPSITTAPGKTVNVTVTGAGNNITTTGAIATGAAGNITFTADDLILGGNLSGTGTLTLLQQSTSQAWRIGGSYTGSTAGSITLSTTELGYLADGWNSIVLGLSSGATGYMDIDAATFNDNLTVRGFYTRYRGAIDMVGSSFTSSSAGNEMHGTGSITTHNQNISFTNGLTLYVAGRSLASNGGNISISGALGAQTAALGTFSVNSGNGNISIGNGTTSINAGSLTSGTYDINAGTGTLTFSGTVNTAANVNGTGSTITTASAWGNTTPLGAVSLTSTNSLTLPSITAASIVAQTTGAAADIIIGAGKTLTASGAGNALTLASGRNFINNSGSSALSATNGRWLVYSADPASNTRGGLMPDATDFNETYAGNPPAGIGAGNRFIFSSATAPTVTLTVNNDSITYGNSYTPNPGYSYASGLVGGDAWGSIGLSGAASYASSYVQGTTNASVTPYSGMITATAGTLVSKLGYLFAFTAGDLTVNKRTITASLAGTVSKTYDGNTSATLAGGNYALSNVYGADAVGIATTAGTYDTATSGSGKTVSVSGLTLNGAKAGNYVLSSTSASGAVGTVNQKALTITADNKSIIYGDVIPVGTVSYSGFIAGEDASYLTTAPTVASAQSGIINAGTYAGNYTASGAVATNYAISYAAGDLTVGKKNLSVTGDNKTVTYGAAAPVGTLTYNGFIAGENATFLTTAPTVGSAQSGIINAGSYAGNYTPSGGVSNNYSFTYYTGDLTVSKKTLNVTADNQSITYGTSVPTDTLSYSGFITGEDASFLTTAPTVTSGLSGVQNVGSYANNYTASGGVSGNYSFNYIGGNLAVTAAGLNVTANNVTVTYGTNVPVGSFTITGYQNGDDVTALSSLPILSSANSGLLNAGSYTNNYTTSGGSALNYYFNYIPGTLTVSKKSLDVTADNKTITYGSAIPLGTFTYNGFVNGEDATVLDTAPLIASAQSGIVSAGSYANNYTLSGGLDNNYVFNYIGGALNVDKAALTITAANKSITYGAATPAGTYSIGGFVNGEDATVLTALPSVVSGQSGIVNAGSYLGNYTASGAAANNYTFSYVAGDLNVAKANLNVVAAGQTVTYGTVVPTSSYSITGYVNGDDATDLSTLPTLSSTASGIIGAGTYANNYLVAGGAAANYNFIYTGGTLSVLKKALTITANNQSMTYGNAIPAGTLSYSGFISGEDASYLTTAPTVASAQSGIIDAGSYVGNYTASGAASNNYAISYAAGDLMVNQRILTASLVGTVSKVYDGTTIATLAGSNYSLANIYGADAVGIATTAGTYDDKNVTTGKTVTVTGMTLNGAKAANYTLASTTAAGAVGTITQKGLTVTAGSRTITYGAAVPADTLSYSGFVGGDTASSLTTAPTIASTQAGTPDAGSYVGNFVASGGVAGNYSFTYVTGNLTVNPRALLVTTDSKSKLFSGADPVFTGSNNLLAGDAALISWAYAPTGYAGATGNYTIAATATDASNRLANYTRTNAYGTFTVNPDNYVPFSNNDIPSSVQVLSQDPSSSGTTSHGGMYSDTILRADTIFGDNDMADNHYIFIYDHADGSNATIRFDVPYFIQIAPHLQQQLGLHQQAI